MNRYFDVIVIGGGASGMMAAGAAAAPVNNEREASEYIYKYSWGAGGRSVLLLEKNDRLGAKLSITGGGRCNITNAEFDIHALLANYGEAQDFLYSAFAQFGVQSAIDFFTSRGLPIVVQDRKRAFPQTERATDVVAVMEKYVRDSGVTVQCDSRVEQFERNSDGGITGVRVNGEIYTAETYIIATGGMSHPETGSTGDGFQFLRDLGHTVQTPTPTIVPLGVTEKWIELLSGQSLLDAKVSFRSNGKKVFDKRGPVLFTHFGLSGPTILNSAYRVSELLHNGFVDVIIDMYPALDIGGYEKYVIELFDANKNKTLKTIIREVLQVGNSDLWQKLFPLLGIDSEILETKVHSITRDQRKQLVALVKSFPLTVNRLMDFDRAVVADGGVVLSEIDMRTMRSRLHPNLAITGDLLHINRPSGGFSLQLCWTTGFVAGVNN
jgi:hypothetical protein